ncbi:MAG: hypothetical protein IPG22_19255 [Acidobacteria bacterium]|nr:hypothetical protein [Acidobacteriota bacterium]
MEIEREIIAERTIYATFEGNGFEVHLILGKPFPSGQDWKCPVAAIGLKYGGLVDIAGFDSWQALMLAQGLLNFHLTNFLENGGKLYWEKDGAELDVENLFNHPRRNPKFDPPVLTDEEYQANIDSLTDEELQKIDEALLAQASHLPRKVARVVGSAMPAVDKRIPDTFYAERVKKLVSEGRLIAEGDMDNMRRSEVRLPGERNGT